MISGMHGYDEEATTMWVYEYVLFHRLKFGRPEANVLDRYGPRILVTSTMRNTMALSSFLNYQARRQMNRSWSR